MMIFRPKLVLKSQEAETKSGGKEKSESAAEMRSVREEFQANCLPLHARTHAQTRLPADYQAVSSAGAG